MERNSSPALVTGTRWSSPEDAVDLAKLHADTWRYAYAGVIPGAGLERMISRRGPTWWRRLHTFGGRALVGVQDGAIAGYALVGRNRGGPGGEIQELYVRPEYQGVGVGGRLFEAAHGALIARAIAPLTVWCLAENRIGTAFYRAKGGQEMARRRERVAGADLEKIGFVWT